MSKARIMGLVARWVMLLAEVPQDRLQLFPGVELVVLYGVLVGRLDLRDLDARPAPRLVEFDAERGVRHAPIRHHLPIVDAKKVTAGAPQVRRRQGDQEDQHHREAPHEPVEAEPLALLARRLRTRVGAARDGTPGLLPLGPWGRTGGRPALVPGAGYGWHLGGAAGALPGRGLLLRPDVHHRSEEHTSELQSRQYLVCRL